MRLNENEYKLVYKDEIMRISNDPIQILTSEELLTGKILIDEKSMKKYSSQSHLHDDKYKILDIDYKYLSDYQICDRSIIHIDLHPDLIQIFIKSDKTIFPIYIYKSDKISDIKNKNELKKHFNFHELILNYQGEILDDDKSIDEYQICDQSVIDIDYEILRSRGDILQIFVRKRNGETFNLYVNKMAIIGHITPRIEQEMGLNENGYKLVYKDEIMSISNEPIQTETIYQKSIKNYSLKPKFQDDKYKILEDFCYLSDYQICDRSVIYVGLKDDAIQIYIESDKTKFPIYVHKNVKIRDIKYSIRRRIHSNFHEVKLIYRGEILDDDKSIDEYQICDQSVINIVEQYNLYFNINNKKIKTKFQKSDKIIDIKYKIQDKIGLHPDEQILIYQGEILDDDKSIDEYQICDRSVIDVALKDDTIQIYIESDKTKFPIYVHKNVKIRDIKYSIRRRIHSNFYEVKLIYQGEILDDFKRIDHYKICEKSVINIVEPFDVHFNINNKKIIKEIHKSDKIIDIKYKIQDKIGLHRDLQQLVYQNEILDDDDKMIGQYGIIRENSTIDVLIKEGINVFVKRINGNANEFTILETQKIKDIMKAMNIKEQILIYQDKILEKEKTFAEYGISNKSIIWAVECRQEMQIIVILIEQLTIVFHVEKASNIHQLRNEIVQKIGKNLDKYDLQYKDIILNENSQDLMKYDSDESVMFIKALPRMKIFVKTKYGRTILLKLKHHSTVMDIKYNVQEQIGLDRTDQKLVYLDKILDDDDKSIIDYKICENSVLQISDMNEIQIIIATIDGKTFSLQMRKTEKIIDLKNKILGKIGLRLNEQTLTYQGELLKDEKSLNDYQINDGSLITIVIPINGGVNVSIKIHDTFAFDIGVQGNEMISEVKRRIGLEIDLSSDDLKLICQNLILDDNNTLENYQFINGSELIINVQMRDEINIIFTTMDGSRFLLKYLKQSYIISDLKLRIQERIKIHPDMQKLIYNTNVLNDDDTSIGDYQILDYSIINIEIENKILCGMNDKMSDIRKKIENQIQLDSQHKVLIFDRKVLEDDNLFIYFQIKSRQEVIIDENFKKFMNAIKFNQLDDVKNHFVNDYLRVKYGSYLNYPIHYACKFASKEIINFLIENTCDLEITELENRTPLHLACIYGNIEAIQTLIDHNCNINAIDYLNRRPIHLACENNHKDVVEILIKNKCEIEIYDYRNRFPLDIAKESKLDDIINIIYIRKVADGMRLSCIDGCNHKFCFKSIFWNQFKGKLIYGGVHDKIYSCGESITDSNKKFAYKKIDKERMSKYIEGKINDFIEILRNVRIIEYFGGYEMKRNKFVFMEYIETGSLRQQIGKPTLLLMKTIKQLLEALEFLHRKEIIHRDIKPDNILLDVLGNIKLIDFEFSCELSLVKEETLLKERFYGTLHYMAPEIMNDEMYSCSVDIWSLGITVIEMATGKIPYHSLKQCEFIDRIIKTREIIYELPNSSSDSGNLKLLIDQMLISDGSKRVGAHELIISFDAYFPNLHE